MSKKKLAALIAAALMTLSASSAFAAFSSADNELFRVVFSTDAAATTTVVQDLGALSSLVGTSQTLAGTAFSYGTLGSTANAGNTYEIFFAKNNKVTGTTYDVYAASAAAPTSGNRTYANTNSSITGFYNIYAGQAASTTGAISDYTTKLEKSGLGNLAGFLTTGQVEYSLASVAALNLYKFSATSNATFPVTTGTNVDANFSILTNSNGSVSLQETATTPIPPSFLLMGSGLLGMVGLRRKKA